MNFQSKFETLCSMIHDTEDVIALGAMVGGENVSITWDELQSELTTLRAENETVQHDLEATQNERTFVQNDLDDAEEEIKRLKKRAELWGALESQLKLYRESYADLHNEDHPYIPKMLDLMATLEKHHSSK